VEVVQADVSDDDHLERVFAEPRSGGPGFDYVVNLAAETAHGKSDELYQKTVDGAGKLATYAASSGTVKKFVHVSTAQVYKGDRGKPPACREDAPTSPWTVQAEYMLRSEDAVKAVGGLPWVILRPATVYGPGDVNGACTRTCARAGRNV
jgi:nucleoside-diphosphate-sugar epimerase